MGNILFSFIIDLDLVRVMSGFYGVDGGVWFEFVDWVYFNVGGK